MKLLEQFIESVLWNARLLILIPVLASLVLSAGVLIVTTVDAVNLIGQMLAYTAPALSAEARLGLRLDNISEVVAIVDGYLLAAIMLIFSLGIYELFINKIDVAEASEFAERLLLIRSLDDLKNRLANVILLILIVKFFQLALNMKYSDPLELLYLALGVILIAGALYLSGRAKPAAALKPESKNEEKSLT